MGIRQNLGSLGNCRAGQEIAESVMSQPTDVESDELEFVAINFETISDEAGQLAELVVYGLPDDSFNKYVGSVMAVSKDDVRKAANRYIDPEKVAIVIVGDRQKIEAGIAALGLGTIRNLTIDEVLGPAPSTGTGQ